MSASNYIENAVADHIFRGGSLCPQPTELHVALFTTLPDEDNIGGVEPAAASYARVHYGPSATHWTAPADGDGRCANAFAVTFPTPTEDWGTIVGYGVFDQDDNLWFANNLAAAKDVLAGNPAPEFNPGALAVIIAQGARMAEITEVTDTQAEWATGSLSSVVATANGLELGAATEDFEAAHGLTDGGLAVSLSADHAAGGTKSLLGSTSKAYGQRVRPEVVARGDDFFLSGMVLTKSGYETSGLCGVCFGVPAGVGSLGYQVILDIRNGSASNSGFQLRRDYSSANYLTGAEVTIVADTWYRIDVTWSSAGLITVELYAANGDFIASASTTDSTYTSGKCGVCCYESSHFDDLVLPFYADSGQRTAAAIDLSTLASYSAGTVSWTATDNGQTVGVEVNLSLDGGSSWEGWQAVTNGGAIPGINVADLSNALLQVRQALSTTDNAVTPQIHSLTVYVSTSTAIMGVVTQEGAPVARTVRGYNRVTGALLAETTSSALDGSFTLAVNTDTECYVVTLDDTADADDYNAQIADRIVPGAL